jgi:hypothetical protein
LAQHSKPLKGLKENTSVYQSLYVVMGHHMRKKREAVAKYENKLNKTLRKIPLTADVPSAAFINDTQASKSPALLLHNNRTLVLKKSGREANSHCSEYQLSADGQRQKIPPNHMK